MVLKDSPVPASRVSSLRSGLGLKQLLLPQDAELVVSKLEGVFTRPCVFQPHQQNAQ